MAVADATLTIQMSFDDLSVFGCPGASSYYPCIVPYDICRARYLYGEIKHIMKRQPWLDLVSTPLLTLQNTSTSALVSLSTSDSTSSCTSSSSTELNSTTGFSQETGGYGLRDTAYAPYTHSRIRKHI